MLAAVNQTLTSFEHPVASGDEVAFFPPVTGADMTQTRIVVSPARFSVSEEYPWLAERDEDGAVVTFTGKVRNHNLGDSVKALTLEHYPGMTENRWRKLSSWRASAGRWAG